MMLSMEVAENTKNCTSHKSSQGQREEARDSAILWGGITRVLTSITRYGRDGRKYLEKTSSDCGRNWRTCDLSMLRRLGRGRIKAEGGSATSQTWKRRS